MTRPPSRPRRPGKAARSSRGWPDEVERPRDRRRRRRCSGCWRPSGSCAGSEARGGLGSRRRRSPRLQAALTAAEQAADRRRAGQGPTTPPTTTSSSCSARRSRPRRRPSSLLVEIQALAARSGITFDSLALSRSVGQAAPAPSRRRRNRPPTRPQPTRAGAREAVPADASRRRFRPTEAAAATLPLGATVGPRRAAGDAVRPASSAATSSGRGLHPGARRHGLLGREAGIGVDGRLVTIDGFSLGPDQEPGLPEPGREPARHHLRRARPIRALTAGAAPSAADCERGPAGAPPTPRLEHDDSAVKPEDSSPRKFLSDLYRDLRDRRLLHSGRRGAGGDRRRARAAEERVRRGVRAAVRARAHCADEATAVAPAVLVDDAGVRDYRKRLAAAEERRTRSSRSSHCRRPESVALQDSGGGTAGVDLDPTASLPRAADRRSSSTPPSPTRRRQPPSAATRDHRHDRHRAGRPPRPAPRRPRRPSRRSRRPASTPAASTSRSASSATRSGSTTCATSICCRARTSPSSPSSGSPTAPSAAVFSVSRDVVETDGDGSCAPKKPAPCQYLTLEVGDQQTFKSADGTTYRLRLLQTHVVRVPDPRDAARRRPAGPTAAD